MMSVDEGPTQSQDVNHPQNSFLIFLILCAIFALEISIGYIIRYR